jgi:transcriptional regulator with PAS, ATPase and Fis domain
MTIANEPTKPLMTLVTDQPQTLREMEDQMIQQVLDKHDSDKPAAAKELGIALKTLYNRLSQMESKRDAG